MNGSTRRYAAEFIGTSILVAIGPGAVMVAASTNAFGHLGVALAFGLAVTFIVASTGRIGGAHINPAVTLGFWATRQFPTRDVIPYIVAQCAGAVAASVACGWLLGPVGDFGATVPAVSTLRALAIEGGYSAILGLVIVGVGGSPAAPFAIGATVFAGALVTGPLTGGSFNPARSLGPAVAGGIWTAHWLYWMAPILGVWTGMRLGVFLQGATITPGSGNDAGTQS